MGDILLIGGPDTGKTNFLARLVAHLRDGKGRLTSTALPDDLRYVEEALAFLEKGQFAPRSHNSTEEVSGGVEIEIQHADGSGETSVLCVPDVAGETWDDAVSAATISNAWDARLRNAHGAMLFVRVLSDLNVQPLDWVVTPTLLSHAPGADAPAMPTQVSLCQLLRILEEKLGQSAGKAARLAVVVTAYDLLDAERAEKGPLAYLQREFPLFAGKIAHGTTLETGVFGLSVVGGDFSAKDFRADYLSGDIVENGYIVDGTTNPPQKSTDITGLLSWVTQSQPHS